VLIRLHSSSSITLGRCQIFGSLPSTTSSLDAVLKTGCAAVTPQYCSSA